MCRSVGSGGGGVGGWEDGGVGGCALFCYLCVVTVFV